MTAVALTYQLSSVSDGDGGELVSAFALDTTNVFQGGGFATGGTRYYGYPSATNPASGGVGNAYATIDIDLSNPANALTTAQLDLLVYGDCTIGGMMGSVCMTGKNGGGTMAAYPYSQTISVNGNTAQTVAFGTAPSLSASASSGATVSATASSGLTVMYSSMTPAVCYVTKDTGVVNAIGSSVVGSTCTVAADQYGNSQYAPAERTTQNLTVAQ